ncbi:hypothetical protein AB1Y20_018929 [Prymnesium parvum]|uniref:Uncharacterized protein n=1 Tax=Prymnesium parvum TaxID=97485 RepID=A0AB34JR57_PRYPA
MYTDDGHQAILGPQLTVVALRVCRKIMGELRLTMAMSRSAAYGRKEGITYYLEPTSFCNGGAGCCTTKAQAPLSIHAAIDHAPGGRPVVIPATASVVFFLRSDASKDGARLPGLSGALGVLLWRYPHDYSPLSAAEFDLPAIAAVLEFAAYFIIGTVETYADLIASDVMVVSEVDDTYTAYQKQKVAPEGRWEAHLQLKIAKLRIAGQCNIGQRTLPPSLLPDLLPSLGMLQAHQSTRIEVVPTVTEEAVRQAVKAATTVVKEAVAFLVAEMLVVDRTYNSSHRRLWQKGYSSSPLVLCIQE